MRGDHQNNGVAESTLQQLRLKAGILINQIEEAVAGGRNTLPCHHPLYNWALLHAAWFHNRYVANGGSTAFERAADRVYTGRLCMFGEVVLGYIKTSRKAAPRWTQGIWVGKTLPNDGHIIIHAEGIFVTRSVRRLPTPFVLEPLGEITTSPWDHGCASLGHRMLYTKNISPPLAVSMPMIDVDAEHVKTYAATHVGSDSDREDPLEAGNETGEAKASNTADTAIDSGSMDAPGPTTSQKRGGADSPVLPGSPKMQRVGDDQPTTPRDDTMDPSGERAANTPRLENSPDQQRMLQVTSTDLSLYEHEDSPVKFDFNSDDVDYMDKYDDQFLHEDDPCLIGDADMSKITEQLTSNLRFLTLPKHLNSVLMSSCVWTHSQTSLNFRGWSVCRFYKALMQCHLLQMC